jgi:hypothetical protein
MLNQPVRINPPIFWVYGDGAYQRAKQIAREEEGVHVTRNNKHQVLKSLKDLLVTDELIDNYGVALSNKERGYVQVGSQEHGIVWVRFVIDWRDSVDFDFISKDTWDGPRPDGEGIWYSLSTPVQHVLNQNFGVNKKITERYFLDDPVEKEFRNFIQKYPLGGGYDNGVWRNCVVVGWSCSCKNQRLQVVAEFNKTRYGVVLDERLTSVDIPPSYR